MIWRAGRLAAPVTGFFDHAGQGGDERQRIAGADRRRELVTRVRCHRCEPGAQFAAAGPGKKISRARVRFWHSSIVVEERSQVEAQLRPDVTTAAAMGEITR
jgi:hypothetical protein